MGLFDIFKKKTDGAGSGTGGSGSGPVVRTETIEFTVGPNVRQVDSRGVAALDDALAEVGSGEVMHLIDPRRINAFSSGGPSTWSVAVVPVGDDHYFVTYGNSDRIDPERSGVGFELAIRVPARTAGVWPGLLLRQLVRYMLTSKRELKVGDYLPFPDPLTRVTTPPGAPSDAPVTTMNTVFLVADPLLPKVNSPRGPIEIRRVVGLFPDERALMELWSVRGLTEVLMRSSADLVTDVSRTTLAEEVRFRDAMAEGSRREGSQFGFVAVPGVRWEASASECQIVLPGGREGLRIHKMIQARLHHGRTLLIHDVDPGKRLAVALEPAAQLGLEIRGEVAVVRIPLDAPHLSALSRPEAGSIVWKFLT